MAKRRRSELSKATNGRLKTYSLAAMAAGVGALALAQPAEGEVVITRKRIPIPVSSYFGNPHPVYISLNNDGINDFSFYLYSFAYHSQRQLLFATPLEGGAIDTKGGFYATELARGAKIGSSAQFGGDNLTRIEGERAWQNGSSSTAKTYVVSYGPWGGNKKNTYMGVKFLINGETHFGWVRLTVGTGNGLSGTITAYAYETVANKRILVGLPEGEKAVIIDENQKPSLGSLAAGADGLARWRNRAAPNRRREQSTPDEVQSPPEQSPVQ